jgi:membrane protein implicated in regulation of membrane protease activity
LTLPPVAVRVRVDQPAGGAIKVVDTDGITLQVEPIGAGT